MKSMETHVKRRPRSETHSAYASADNSQSHIGWCNPGDPVEVGQSLEDVAREPLDRSAVSCQHDHLRIHHRGQFKVASDGPTHIVQEHAPTGYGEELETADPPAVDSLLTTVFVMKRFVDYTRQRLAGAGAGAGPSKPDIDRPKDRKVLCSAELGTYVRFAQEVLARS